MWLCVSDADASASARALHTAGDRALVINSGSAAVASDGLATIVSMEMMVVAEEGRRHERRRVVDAVPAIAATRGVISPRP